MTIGEETDALVRQIKPLLAGRAPEIVAGALADLTAMLIAGFQTDADDLARLHKLRSEFLDLIVENVKELVVVYDDAREKLSASERQSHLN